jgi:hypothetical protein
MIETYGNDMSFHKVLKAEVKNGGIDGVRTIVIHQLVETGREDGCNGGAVNTEGDFIMRHEVTLFMLKDEADDAMTLEVA